MEQAKILSRCGSLSNYQRFRFQWAYICAKLNPTKANKKRLREVMRELPDEE